jgi:tricorn protease
MSAMLHPLFCLLLLACNVPAQPDLAFPDQGEVAPAPMVAGPPALELPRHPALSPDGSKVAFAHQGDIWVADVADGMAMRLTAHDSFDARPSWSADGQELAFVSNRHSNYDVYLMPAWGGTPTRVTYDSESERLNEWIDGDRILVSATKERNYSRRGRGAWVAYRDGRTPTLLGDWPMQNPTLTADGGALVYERGHGDPSRRAYRGPASSELWVTDLASGEDRALTTFDGNDLQPMLAGDWVYFLSDRACPGNDGGRDLGLWRVPFRGGRPELVFHPGGRSLRNAALSADGGHAVAELDAGLVLIDLADGKARELRVHGSFDPSEPRFRERTVDSGASQLAVSPDGDSIAFVAAGDIYVMRHSDKIKRAVRVTTHPAPDGSPVWVEDGKALLFVSERDGNGELYKVRVAGDAAEESDGDGDQAEVADDEGDEESMPFYLARDFSLERMTETAEDESWPSLSPEGSLLAWVQGAGRLVVGDPETLAVSRTITDGFEAPSYDWAPDGRWMVYSQSDDDFNYDVFLARTVVEEGEEGLPGATPYNLTRHPDDDTGPSWSPDGRFITFTSRRMMNDESDVWMVYLQAADRERNERERLEAEEREKKAKKKPGKPKKAEPAGDAPAGDVLSGAWEGMATGPDLPEQGLPFSMNLTLQDGAVEGDISSAMYTGPISQPSWDAEAKVLTFTLDIPDSGGVPVTLRFDGDSCSGEATPPGELYQLSAKRTGAGDAEQDGGAETDEKKDEPKVDPVVIDWSELNRRIVRMTRREGNERAVGWGHDSKKIFFNASTGTRLTSGTTAETGFFSVAVEDRSDSRVESGTVGSFLTGEKGVYYVRGGRIIGNTGKATSYSFSVRYREDRRAVRKAVMEQGWRALDRNFYDPGFHGHDWAGSLAKWQPLALAASTPEDYGEMVNWMLGEMNASHMGYWGFGSSSPDEVDVNRTGRLGVIWDGSHEGAGRRIAKVLPGGPAARSISRLEAGEVVLAVDGEEYLPGGNWARLMEGTANRETVLLVRGADGAEREVVLRPTSSIGGLLYRAQSEERRAKVEEASGGRLGYVHIEAMGTASLLDFERELFDAGHGKDVLLIDVRENGGGWTTDMVLAMLMVKDHAFTIPRGGGEGYPQGRRIFATWNKPVVVLCNENSYSNAEIFSWSIKTLGRGPIVGKQTYGAVISTGGAGLLDGSFVRMPFRGWYVNDEEKTNMEFMGCPPDYPVEVLPADHAAGRDPQLDKAVEVGLGLLDG